MGPLTATRTFADDVRVQTVLTRFAKPDEALTNQEKVAYALDRIVDTVLAQARMDRAMEIADGAAAAAEAEIAFEDVGA